MSGATGRQRVRDECFDQFFLAQPPEELLAHFESITRPQFELIHCGRKTSSKPGPDETMPYADGRTAEERFVKDVLCPVFEPRGVFLFPTILTTKVVKSGPNFKGGGTNYAKLRADLSKLLLAVSGGLAPEDINENPDPAPSKRLKQVFPSFKKTLHGPTAAKRIGLDSIRARCPHFDSWIARLEELAAI